MNTRATSTGNHARAGDAATSRYHRDPRVRHEHGGYTVSSNGRRVRVMPYEGGRRWGVFTGPPDSTVLGRRRDAPEYGSADEAIHALLGA